MSVSPGRKSSPGFCHICRQRNRSAQKQIICPIYRGSTACPPLQAGPGTNFLEPKQALPGAPRIEYKLTPSEARISDFFGLIQGVTGGIESAGYFAREHWMPPKNRLFGAYSAAAVNVGFKFADDTMKSEMRGTISDLKREPLNTP